MPTPVGMMRLLSWTAEGTYPTRGIVCEDGVFIGQYRQAPVSGYYRYPLSGASACYRIVGNERVVDGPADALVCEDFAWWEGELYASGWTLDASHNALPCLWRRAAEDDWDLLFCGASVGQATPVATWGTRLFTTAARLIMLLPIMGTTGARGSAGIAYTGSFSDLGALDWAGEVDGQTWVVTPTPIQPLSALDRIGARGIAWGRLPNYGAQTQKPWYQYPVIDNEVVSEPVVWRGHAWVLVYNWADSIENVSLAWVDADGTLTTQWQGAWAHTESPLLTQKRVMPALVATGRGLWGFLTGFIGVGGSTSDAVSATMLSDRWLLYDGRTVFTDQWGGRAIGQLVVPAWGGQRETWLICSQDAAVDDMLTHFGSVVFSAYKTPRDLCVYGVGIEWADGTGGAEEDGPQVGAVEIEWGKDPLVDWDHTPAVAEVSAEWSDGSGGETPLMGLAEIEWADGTAVGQPTVLAASIEWEVGQDGDDTEDEDLPVCYQAGIEWADCAPEIGASELALWLTEDGDTLCSKLRIVVGGLTPAEQALCRVYVRTDSEDLDVDAWHTYQVTGMRQNVLLDSPGYHVRVGIVGPDTLPVPDVCVETVRG